ncbi:MAG: Trp family transcriptional regulator [Candidatus Paceibacterota bacterium]|jgi:uncharacterized protein YerC
MPHISRNKISEETFLKINDQLLTAVVQSKNKLHGKQFLNELLTRTERVMLAKRLALFVMLAQKVPERKIADTLQISLSTVWRLGSKDPDNYKFIIETAGGKTDISLTKLFSSRSSKTIWRALDNYLSGFK